MRPWFSTPIFNRFFAVLALCQCWQALWAHGDAPHFHSYIAEESKPWTHLEFLNDPDDFQFAIVTDRTGSPRKGVLEDAIQKLNWMRPEFVMSVGDLIRGNSRTEEGNIEEWDEILGMVSKLDMPFFFLAGNHDIQAKDGERRKGRIPYEMMKRHWEERFGRTYYYYVYKDVLFIALFSNDGGEQQISDQQVRYFQEVLAKHEDVRWTMVFLHHPLWLYAHESNFDEVEELLQERDYTVFAGHQHRYLHIPRKDRNYYVLATTGGGSELRGTQFGEFDHISWVSMTDNGPVVANLRLDGILSHDVVGVEQLKRASNLAESMSVESKFVFDSETVVEEGILLMTFRNSTNERLGIEGSFSHNHYLSPSPGMVSLELNPGEERVLKFVLRVIEPFSTQDKLFMQFDAGYSLIPEHGDAITLDGTSRLPLKAGDLDLVGIESAEFVTAFELKMLAYPEPMALRYTLDGSEPNERSPIYRKPITLTETTVVRARLFDDSGLTSPVSEARFERIESGQGLLCEYYELDEDRGHAKVLPDFRMLTPTRIMRVDEIDPASASRRNDSVGLVYTGYIDVPVSGEYLFHLTSDDGARLIVDDKIVIDDPIKHPPREAIEAVSVEKGKRRFELQYFQVKDQFVAKLEYTLPNGERRRIPRKAFSFDGKSLSSDEDEISGN